jgi:hypothetical protein
MAFAAMPDGFYQVFALNIMDWVAPMPVNQVDRPELLRHIGPRLHDSVALGTPMITRQHDEGTCPNSGVETRFFAGPFKESSKNRCAFVKRLIMLVIPTIRTLR